MRSISFEIRNLLRVTKLGVKPVYKNFFAWMVNQESRLIFRLLLPVLKWTFGIKLLKTFPSQDELTEYGSWMRSKFQESENLAPNFYPSTKFFPNENLGETPKSIRMVFLDLHPRNTLTSDVIHEMYLSCQVNSSFKSEYYNLTELGHVSIGNLLYDLTSDNDYTNIIVFEVHTNSDLNGGLLDREYIFELKNRVGNLVMPICFDIYREFDRKFIEHWEPLCLAILHVDVESASVISTSKPLIFWPFVFPANKRNVMHHNVQEINLYDKPFLFSGSFMSRDRMMSLLNLKIAGFKYGYKIRIRVKDEKQDKSKERNAYLGDLHSALAVLNFNARQDISHPLLTFRAIETIIVNGCLLDQGLNSSNSSLAKIATPYKHFIPFESDLELIKLCWFLNENSDVALKVRSNCQELTSELLSESNLWKYLESRIVELY